MMTRTGVLALGAQRNAAAGYPQRSALPKPGFLATAMFENIADHDLLTPQAQHLNAWYLKHGLTRHG